MTSFCQLPRMTAANFRHILYFIYRMCKSWLQYSSPLDGCFWVYKKAYQSADIDKKRKETKSKDKKYHHKKRKVTANACKIKNIKKNHKMKQMLKNAANVHLNCYEKD